MDLHAFIFAPFAEIYALGFLFDPEKKEIEAAFLINIDDSVSAEGALIAVNDLRADSPKVNLLVDIQAKLREGKGAGYARWAKVLNL